MATLSKGYTFGATETVTSTKLATLIDDATITGIVNADIDAAAAIAETKLAPDGSKYVRVSTNQTIDGTKTFSSIPVLPSTSCTSANQAARKQYVVDSCNNIVPIGMMMPWPTEVAPTDYILCDGLSRSRSSYADLYAVIGNTYKARTTITTRTDDDTGVLTVDGGSRGITTSDTLTLTWTGGTRAGMTVTTVAGDLVTVDGGTGDNLPVLNTAIDIVFASNQFFTPDVRGRILVGTDDMGGNAANRCTASIADAVGNYEGSQNHILTVAELAVHTHDNGYRAGTVSGTTNDYYGTGSKPMYNPAVLTDLVVHLDGNWVGTTTLGSMSCAMQTDNPAAGYIMDECYPAGNGTAHAYYHVCNEGSSSTHNNLQPGLYVNYIIRAFARS